MDLVRHGLLGGPTKFIFEVSFNAAIFSSYPRIEILSVEMLDFWVSHESAELAVIVRRQPRGSCSRSLSDSRDGPQRLTTAG